MLVIHGHLHLRFERLARVIRPSERRVVGDVGEGQRASRMRLTGGTHSLRAAVSERACLLMTACARVGAVAGESRVVEQAATELNFFFGNRVVRRDQGRWE